MHTELSLAMTDDDMAALAQYAHRLGADVDDVAQALLLKALAKTPVPTALVIPFRKREAA